MGNSINQIGENSMDLDRIASMKPPPLPTNDLRARGVVELNVYNDK